MSDTDVYPRRKLMKGTLCEYENCDHPATVIACGRNAYSDRLGHPEPGVYCDLHAAKVTDERCPEYVDSCPNCGCGFGVN